jgi:hypothetical protein
MIKSRKVGVILRWDMMNRKVRVILRQEMSREVGMMAKIGKIKYVKKPKNRARRWVT